jgi:hypothetical protein
VQARAALEFTRISRCWTVRVAGAAENDAQEPRRWPRRDRASTPIAATWSKRGLGRDPMLGASIVLTASTDSLGFLLFLGLAALFLG